MALDISRLTTGLLLPPEVSNEIWTRTSEGSIVTQVAQRMDLPGVGKAIPIITANAEASWVNETDLKPVSNATFDNKLISPYMLEVTLKMSNQFKRDANAIYNKLVSELPNALAAKFDRTVFGQFAAPGSNFTTLANSPSVSINTAGGRYAALVSALTSAAGADADVTAWIFAPAGNIALLGEVDADGRPLFTLSPNSGGVNSIGQVLGAPVYKSKHVAFNPTTGPDVVGFAGDFATEAYWGQTGNIEISVNPYGMIGEGSGAQNLWQRNMFAIRCEVELGFQVTSDQRFVKLTGATTA